MKKWLIAGVSVLAALAVNAVLTNPVALAEKSVASGRATRVQVVFSGGHETVSRDRGRPVVLIAAALGVPDEVFREAFSRVRPARNGHGPTDAEARANKKVLMDALAPYCITDQRLNEVSNYYRYRREEGELWPTRPAVAYALVKDGKITGYEVEQGGSGYSSYPQISVPGIKDTVSIAQLSFSKEFENNGAVSMIAPPQADKK